jgi:hypothetical protein
MHRFALSVENGGDFWSVLSINKPQHLETVMKSVHVTFLCGEYKNSLSNNYMGPATFTYHPTQHHPLKHLVTIRDPD